MKKSLMSLFAVLILLSVAIFANASTWTHEASGIVIELPEGMTCEDTSSDDVISLYVNSEDEDAPVYHVFLEYDEDYVGLWMEDLDEEALQSIAEYYVPEGQTAAYTLLSGENVTLMAMVNSENTEASIIALLNGWFISVEATATEDNQLAQGAYDTIEMLVAGIQLPETAEV